MFQMIGVISLFSSMAVTVMWSVTMVVMWHVTTAQGARDRDIIIIPDMSQHWPRPGAGRAQSDQKSPFKFRLINIFWAEKNDSEIFLNLNDYLQK